MGAGYHGGFGNTQGSINNEPGSKNQLNSRQDYLRNELSRSSPLVIPKTAEITDQNKVSYVQVRYEWKKANFKYVARWHTRTPGAPAEQGPTWVIERIQLGIGNGKNLRRRKEFILVGKYKWVTKKVWHRAIRARNNGSATKQQLEILDHGHWKA